MLAAVYWSSPSTLRWIRGSFNSWAKISCHRRSQQEKENCNPSEPQRRGECYEDGPFCSNTYRVQLCIAETAGGKLRNCIWTPYIWTSRWSVMILYLFAPLSVPIFENSLPYFVQTRLQLHAIFSWINTARSWSCACVQKCWDPLLFQSAPALRESGN